MYGVFGVAFCCRVLLRELNELFLEMQKEKSIFLVNDLLTLVFLFVSYRVGYRV